MKSAEIRETFLKFFENYHHQRVKSSSIVPAADPTLLFTSAGMVQFKDNFLGLVDAGYHRATTCQKCVRAGGKHNDLENVGFTARHHTFFEMLGNFSYGDSFKKESIAFAWELVTRHLKIPIDRLRVTVYEKDDEAFDLWKAQGVKPECIGRLGEKDNFWAAGDTGPCGPCTEIYYDFGAEHGCKLPQCAPGCDCPRFLEFWNLVFMQFSRDISGKMTPLPKPSVDTGAGLERIAAILQGKFSNYDSDVFEPIFKAIMRVTGRAYGQNEESDIAMRVIADHIRAGTFLVSDGVMPSNEGRGYVLRRILRRAIRYGKKLGQEKPFMHLLVGDVCEAFSAVYPELLQHRKAIEVTLKEEEERFHETLHRGIGILDDGIKQIKAKKGTILPGDIAFKLYDSFGFPLDLVQVIAKEHNLEVDEKGFEALMDKQRSQSSWSKGGDAQLMENLNKAIESKKWETPFLGYDNRLTATAECLMLMTDTGNAVNELAQGSSGFAILKETPFYAESGGQVGDKGQIKGKSGVTNVVSTFKIGRTIVHRIQVAEGKIEALKSYDLVVDPRLRHFTAINHTATHMLHAALRTVLGDRVKQAGSSVDPEKLRFDFTFPRGMTGEEVTKVEAIINEEVAQDDVVTVKEMPFDEAIKSGALAFFDEKYGDRVRVVRVGDTTKSFSVELCGGTHLNRTSEVGIFKIVSESSVASGVRRIEAITSVAATHYLLNRHHVLAEIETKLNSKGDQLTAKVDALANSLKTLQRENETLKVKVAQGASRGDGGPALHDKAITIASKGIKVVVEVVEADNPKILRALVDQIRDKLKEKVIVVLGAIKDGKVSLCVGVSKDLVGQYDSGKLIQPLALALGGTGGGKADFAQAGGSKPEALAETLNQFKKALSE